MLWSLQADVLCSHLRLELPLELQGEHVLRRGHGGRVGGPAVFAHQSSCVRSGVCCSVITCIRDGGVIEHGHVVKHAAWAGLQMEGHPGELDNMPGGAGYHPSGKGTW